MRVGVCLAVAAFVAAACPAAAQDGRAGAAFWKSVQTACDATAAKPPGELGRRIARLAIEEFGLFGGHRIDADGRLFQFGVTEAEHKEGPTREPQARAGELRWWRVMKYWQSLFGKDAPEKLEVLGFGDASAAAQDGAGVSLIRTTAARLLRAAENEADPETREALREAAMRMAAIDTSWSAAFISYVIKQAGVPEPAFQLSNAHRAYIYDAFATSAAETRRQADAHIYRACPIGATRPRPGDLICMQRERTLADASDRAVRERIRTELDGGADARTVRSTHCEVVAHVDAAARKLYTIGGNVDQSVTARKLNLRGDMKFSTSQKGHCGGAGHWTLPQPGGAAAPAPTAAEKCSLNDKNWFVLLQLR